MDVSVGSELSSRVTGSNRSVYAAFKRACYYLDEFKIEESDGDVSPDQAFHLASSGRHGEFFSPWRFGVPKFPGLYRVASRMHEPGKTPSNSFFGDAWCMAVKGSFDEPIGWSCAYVTRPERECGSNILVSGRLRWYRGLSDRGINLVFEAWNKGAPKAVKSSCPDCERNSHGRYNFNCDDCIATRVLREPSAARAKDLLESLVCDSGRYPLIRAKVRALRPSWSV